ncbi:MAG: hypothetical protein GY699_07760 [Desulfobacteraceae bacterium]|nr:hypothetical protein [Desulfobacteraceae bacterium]
MNKALEIHDSTLSEIKKEGLSITLCLGKAVMHHSTGEPGLDRGTCWIQKIEIRLKNPQIISEPDDIPNQLDFGYFVVNETKYTNVIKTPLHESVDTEVFFETFYGKELHVKAKGIEIIEIGEPTYLQGFEP